MRIVANVLVFETHVKVHLAQLVGSYSLHVAKEKIFPPATEQDLDDGLETRESLVLLLPLYGELVLLIGRKLDVTKESCSSST